MPFELIYTSVPRGVKPGSSGYCTVAKHKGIDRLLDQAVEKISYYEMMNHPAKPVVHNYRIIVLNTGTFHVLTRTAYSGSDHTGRTNYISHNLIFEQSETYSQRVSPAEIFLSEGWLEIWDQGRPPAFLEEGACMVTLPQESSNEHSALQNWQKFTGKGTLAHEIKGYDKWKLITDAGQQKDVLSLLSEFAQLDPSCLLSSWSKWTFSTYLQPSESPDNFQIIAGEPSVPSFASLSCATLNISSSATEHACFSATGNAPFSPLPELNQPVQAEPTPEISNDAVQTVPGSEVAVDPTPSQPIAGGLQKPRLKAQPQATFTPRPLKPSNINLGPTSDPTSLPTSTTHSPKPGSSKTKIILFVILGLVSVGASSFAVYFFLGDKLGKKSRAQVSNPTHIQNKRKESVPPNDGEDTQSPTEEGNSSNEPSPINSDTNSTQEEENPVNPEPDQNKKDLENFLDQVKDRLKTQRSSKNIQDDINSLEGLSTKVDKDKYKTLLQEANEVLTILNEKLKEAKMREMPSLPKEIPISDFGTKEFEIILTDAPPDSPSKTYVWDGRKAVKEDPGKNFPAVYWTKDNKVYLKNDKNLAYSIDKANFAPYVKKENSKGWENLFFDCNIERPIIPAGKVPSLILNKLNAENKEISNKLHGEVFIFALKNQQFVFSIEDKAGEELNGLPEFCESISRFVLLTKEQYKQKRSAIPKFLKLIGKEKSEEFPTYMANKSKWTEKVKPIVEAVRRNKIREIVLGGKYQKLRNIVLDDSNFKTIAIKGSLINTPTLKKVRETAITALDKKDKKGKNFWDREIDKASKALKDAKENEKENFRKELVNAEKLKEHFEGEKFEEYTKFQETYDKLWNDYFAQPKYTANDLDEAIKYKDDIIKIRKYLIKIKELMEKADSSTEDSINWSLKERVSNRIILKIRK